jgi:hypothetical protein
VAEFPLQCPGHKFEKFPGRWLRFTVTPNGIILVKIMLKWASSARKYDYRQRYIHSWISDWMKLSKPVSVQLWLDRLTRERQLCMQDNECTFNLKDQWMKESQILSMLPAMTKGTLWTMKKRINLQTQRFLYFIHSSISVQNIDSIISYCKMN